MSEPMTRPGIGTGVFIRKDGKVLFGKRRGKNGSGEWCPPGGKVEMFEEWEVHCRRETREEAGIEIQNIRFITATNDVTKQWGTHYITLHFVADWLSGEPVDNPAESIGEWGWYSWDELPNPLFAPSQKFKNLQINPLELEA